MSGKRLNNGIQKFRLKPNVVEAVKFNGSSTNVVAIEEWIKTGEYRPRGISTRDLRSFEITSATGEKLEVKPGYWVLKNSDGIFSIYSDDKFFELYEECDDSAGSSESDVNKPIKSKYLQDLGEGFYRVNGAPVDPITGRYIIAEEQEKIMRGVIRDFEFTAISTKTTNVEREIQKIKALIKLYGISQTAEVVFGGVEALTSEKLDGYENVEITVETNSQLKERNYKFGVKFPRDVDVILALETDDFEILVWRPGAENAERISVKDQQVEWYRSQGLSDHGDFCHREQELIPIVKMLREVPDLKNAWVDEDGDYRDLAEEAGEWELALEDYFATAAHMMLNLPKEILEATLAISDRLLPEFYKTGPGALKK